MGLVLKLKNGEGFSLNYEDRRIEVTLIDDYSRKAIFEITRQNDSNIHQIAISYGSSYRIDNLPETTFVPFRSHCQTKVDINAPQEVKIYRFAIEAGKIPQ